MRFPPIYHAEFTGTLMPADEVPVAQVLTFVELRRHSAADAPAYTLRWDQSVTAMTTRYNRTIVR